MCWIGKRENRNIATEDIKVMKALYGEKEGNFSPFYKVHYETDKLYKIPYINELEYFGIGEYGCYSLLIEIREGFHSYNKKCFITLDDENLSNMVSVHSKTNKKEFPLCTFNKSISFYEAIIPEGSVYYENEDGEIVSDKIIVTNIILF